MSASEQIGGALRLETPVDQGRGQIIAAQQEDTIANGNPLCSGLQLHRSGHEVDFKPLDQTSQVRSSGKLPGATYWRFRQIDRTEPPGGPLVLCLNIDSGST
jgi:hypothetical protein